MTAKSARFASNRPWPFLADQTPTDGSLWRFPVALAGGLVAGVLAALVALILLLAVGGAAVIGGLTSLDEIRDMVGLLQNEPALASNLRAMLYLFGVLALFNSALFFGFVLFGSALYRRRFITYLTAAARFRWRLVLLGALLFGLTLGPLMILTRDFGAGEPMGPMPILLVSQETGGRLLFAAVATIALLILAAAEEVLFRGWLLRHLAALLRNTWLAVAAGGLLFSAVHMDFSPEAFVIRAAMGMWFCYATLRLGGIEFALGVHTANNWIIVLFIEPMKLAPEPPQAFTPEAVPSLLLFAAVNIGMVELVARLRPLRRWAGVDEAPAQPAAERLGLN